VIVRLVMRDSDEGIRATLSMQNDPGEAESKTSEAFLVKTKAEARKRASNLAKQHGLKTYRVLDKAAN
jgi:hypothetical protein